MRIRIYIFCFKKYKQKAKETKDEKRKTKEAKEEKEKENVAVLNSICRNSNGIGWHCLRICSCTFNLRDRVLNLSWFNVVYVQREKSQYFLHCNNI